VTDRSWGSGERLAERMDDIGYVDVRVKSIGVDSTIVDGKPPSPDSDLVERLIDTSVHIDGDDLVREYTVRFPGIPQTAQLQATRTEVKRAIQEVGDRAGFTASFRVRVGSQRHVTSTEFLAAHIEDRPREDYEVEAFAESLSKAHTLFARKVRMML